MLLVLTDAPSKRPEALTMMTTTSRKTIAVLRETFTPFGLPEQIVSDNDLQFVSEEYESVLQNNGIKHIRSAPYQILEGKLEASNLNKRLSMTCIAAADSSILVSLCSFVIDAHDACQRPQIMLSDPTDIEMFEDGENIFMSDLPWSHRVLLMTSMQHRKHHQFFPVNDICNC